ncbi:hypothetical protein M9H77_16782 [Catharanthus roseus]|uniref:Uncharacterized protein n=1 Tax=Catharanthus roseus TaxID=4058 RepID=A0ACC0B2R1_CATRO|nr:hypothetical protein M9H77_16782 [Catharanthus roseus]
MPFSIIKMLKKFIVSHGGCGGCGKSKENEILEPKPKPKPKPKPNNTSTNFYPSSSSISSLGGVYDDYYNNTSTSTFSPHCSEINDPTKISGPGGASQYPTKLGDSVAVVTDSDDPYEDFRQSMLQMILEKEIYTKDELQELLNCFLQLNSPDHHHIIVRAFMEIWNGVSSSK